MTARVLIGIFDLEDILRATTAARRAGSSGRRLHPLRRARMDRGDGTAESRLPWVCFLLGLFGAVASAVPALASAFDCRSTSAANRGSRGAASQPIVFETWSSAPASAPSCFHRWAGLRPGAHHRCPTSASPTAIRAGDRVVTVRARSSGVEALLARFHPVSVEERELGAAGRLA